MMQRFANACRPPVAARRQCGLAMVEFVIGAPILLFLIYCVAEFGRAFSQFSQLADAARDADRYLAANAISGTTGVVSITGTVGAATKNLAVYGNTAGMGSPLLPGLATGQVTLSSDPSNRVAVSVAYPYQSIFGGSIPDFFDSGSVNSGAMTITVYTSMMAL